MLKGKKDARRGIYRKFRIYRTDGESTSGGKHEHCKYFVLDLMHDHFAMPALEAYAHACRGSFPFLARDLDAIRRGDRSPLRKLRAR